MARSDATTCVAWKLCVFICQDRLSRFNIADGQHHAREINDSLGVCHHEQAVGDKDRLKVFANEIAAEV